MYGAWNRSPVAVKRPLVSYTWERVERTIRSKGLGVQKSVFMINGAFPPKRMGKLRLSQNWAWASHSLLSYICVVFVGIIRRVKANGMCKKYICAVLRLADEINHPHYLTQPQICLSLWSQMASKHQVYMNVDHASGLKAFLFILSQTAGSQRDMGVSCFIFPRSCTLPHFQNLYMKYNMVNKFMQNVFIMFAALIVQ